MRKLWLAALIALAGCVKSGHRPGDVATPPARPAFERTFGDISVGPKGRLSIHYRDIRLEVHPGATNENLKEPSSIDYLLVMGDPEPTSLAPLNRNLKIIAVPAAAPVLQQAGFSSVKTLKAGDRLLLRKQSGFLFVTAIPSTDGQPPVNGYLLEFDNGRNVLVLGAVPRADDLREFLYGLRDDGKELDLAFLSASPSDEDKTAQVLALLQPRVGLVLAQNSKEGLDRQHLTDRLKQELFYGDVHLPVTGEVIPF